MTKRDIEKLSSHLQEWQGGSVAFNAFHDDHDRLILKLVHPTGAKPPVGLALFYCSYLAGPIRWTDSELELTSCTLENGDSGFQLADKAVGFTVRFASASLYGEPEITIPNS